MPMSEAAAIAVAMNRRAGSTANDEIYSY